MSERGVDRYLANARKNEDALPKKFEGLNRAVRDVSRLYDRFMEVESTDRDQWVTAGLVRRAHSFWMSAYRLCLGGAVPEVFALLRVSLESVTYAYHIHKRPELQRTWLNRHADEKALKAMKDEFLIGPTKRSLRDDDEWLGRRLDHLYGFMIDFGGHPNPGAVFSSAAMTVTEDKALMRVGYLTGSAEALKPTFRRIIEVGLVCLFVIEKLQPARFQILDLDRDLRALDDKLAE